MSAAGFCLVQLPKTGRRRLVVSFATLDAAKQARELYARHDCFSDYSVVPAAMLSDYLSGRPGGAGPSNNPHKLSHRIVVD